MNLFDPIAGQIRRDEKTTTSVCVPTHSLVLVFIMVGQPAIRDPSFSVCACVCT